MATGEELTDRLRELRTSLEALPGVTEPPKPMLRILGSARAEQKWNTLLAYFLDPSQPHGFGADLLIALLDKVGQVTDEEIDYSHRDIEQVSVETEVISEQNNRLDILIRASDEWFACIESKVDASEGDRQTQRYVEDPHIGNEEKDEYPEAGQYYLFLSKEYAPNSSADGFEDLSWRNVVEAFQTELNLSHGQYPERSVSQLEDFLSTIITVTNMGNDDFERVQKEKVQLLSEYRDEIDELLDAADSLHQRAIENWGEMFLRQVDDELWTGEWHLRDDKYGRIFKDGWYLDSNLEPTNDPDEAWGENALRIHFVHYIRKDYSFRQGKLKIKLRTNSLNRVEARDEFHQLYDTDRWKNELQSILEPRNITNAGMKKALTRKQYDVDQSRLPESYFETLATAFEEHLPAVEVIDKILDEAVENVKDS